MPIFANLVDEFNKTVNDLYSLKNHPVKDAAALDPIIFFTPNDPNRPQGRGTGDRLVPTGAVITDERRFGKYLTSPRGLTFLLKQELLQTGNAISETRVLDPLFISKNLSPYVHSKRQLFDQTDITVNDPARSPATTPDVGLAGRLQKQTGADVLSHILGRKTARQTILDVLASTQIAQTVSGLFHVTNGTYAVNQRPEFDVNGRWYSAILYTGRKPLINRELDVVIDALGAAGVASSIIGLPNLFAGLRGKPPLPATSNFSTSGADPLGTMPYFNPEIPGVSEKEAGRYVAVKSTLPPVPLLPTIIPSQMQNIISVGLKTIVNNLLGFNFGSAKRFTNVLTFKPLIAIGPEIRVDSDNELARLRKPERSIRQRYEKPDAATTVLSPDSRDRIAQTKSRLDQQIEVIQKDHQDLGRVYRQLGIVGGITLANKEQFSKANSYAKHQEIRKNLPTSPGNYHDLLNEAGFSEIAGDTLPKEVDGVAFPTDYIDVHFVDRANGRLIPFRAHIEGLNETVNAEYTPTRYIGRTERNLVYLGATRQLTFSLYVHAWSPAELEFVWRRVNRLTGLAFPALYSQDGFMIPPIVELTIGSFYKNQPGYIESITNAIEDGTSWETRNPDSQMPLTVKIGITFGVIEKHSMNASSAFYGFGLPRTQSPPTRKVPKPGVGATPVAVTSVGPISSFTVLP